MPVAEATKHEPPRETTSSLSVTERTTFVDEPHAGGNATNASSAALAADAETGGERMAPLSSTTTSEEVPALRQRVTSHSEVVKQDTSSRRESFVDYTPPPSQKVKPPAKYKLWLMVLFCVFFADWLSYEADIIPWLQDNLGLSFNGALFLLLASIVATLVFAALDLLTFCVRFKWKGEWYGIGWWLKQPRIKWVHEYENFLCEVLSGLVVIFEEGLAMFNAPKPPPPNADRTLPQYFHTKDGNEEHPVVLKIEQRIKPGKDNEYLHWKDKLIKQGCHSRPGLIDVKTEMIPDPDKGNVYVVYLTFSSIDLLNAYMTSPVRARLVRNLEPLLMKPTSLQLQKERTLPDAFTDLCAPQGKSIPKRPPKKWKVWWLTTLGLFFVVLVTNATLTDHYFDKWGLNDAHRRARGLVRVLFNTWLNTYVLTPFLIMIFGNWMKREENEDNPREPWRTLNDGVGSIYGKFAIVFLFYGGCALAWIVK